ncbi:hypothetical protein TrLO_g8756 [Triparma laevis f. longispina]|uniref:Uncharacterized protein n=1 Tax=Triparma laevis f. longispina TaxID=1714387 RepID=A0A9W7CE03_9STRA|nr:hypothetical protein TrLO_g8756 [Triparma laevis f. longispina]
MYCPDQQWHIAMITRVEEMELEDSNKKENNLIQEALLKTQKMIGTEVEEVLAKAQEMVTGEVEKLRTELYIKEKSTELEREEGIANKWKNAGKLQIKENKLERKELTDTGDVFQLAKRASKVGERWRGQVLGYNMGICMNVGLKAAFLILNITILFNTDSVIEIVLNCIALDFVTNIDYEFADASWWDIDKRWIRAGCIELLLRREIERKKLKDYSLMIKDYGFEVEDIDEMEDGKKFKKTGFRDRKRAAKDCLDPSFFDKAYMKNLIQFREIIEGMKDMRPQAIFAFNKSREEFDVFNKVKN